MKTSFERLLAHGNKVKGLLDFIKNEDKEGGVPWYRMRENLCLTRDERMGLKKKYDDYCDEGRRKKPEREEAKARFTKDILQRKAKVFENKDELLHTLKLCKELGLVVQQHPKGPYRCTRGDFMNLVIRENAVTAIHDYSIAEANWMRGTQVFGMPTQELTSKEREHFSRIVADLGRVEWQLMWLRNRVLDRVLNDRGLSDDDYAEAMQDTEGDIHQLGEWNEQHWLLEKAVEDGRINQTEMKLLSRPVVALIAPEMYLSAIDGPLVLPPTDLIRLFGDRESESHSSKEEPPCEVNKKLREQEAGGPHTPNSLVERLKKRASAKDKRSASKQVGPASREGSNTRA